jgi:uncharacterized protein with NRDE domain
MCLIAFAWQPRPPFKLVVAANRDEFYERPTAAAHFWEDAPQLLAGRDLSAGGSWLGVTRDGRFAAVTNYREPGKLRADARSRGELVTEFLRAREPPGDYLRTHAGLGDRYNGFNLLVGDGHGLYYWSNRAGAPRRLSPGLYGLSNHQLDTPWPKVQRAKEGLRLWLAEGGSCLGDLARVLADSEPAPDHLLPATGLGLEWERLLSAMLIASESYGTRCTTVVTWRQDGRIDFLEVPRGPEQGPTRRFSFALPAASSAGADYPALGEAPLRC